jgi:hypothetical protein
MSPLPINPVGISTRCSPCGAESSDGGAGRALATITCTHAWQAWKRDRALYELTSARLSLSATYTVWHEPKVTPSALASTIVSGKSLTREGMRSNCALDFFRAIRIESFRFLFDSCRKEETRASWAAAFATGEIAGRAVRKRIRGEKRPVRGGAVEGGRASTRSPIVLDGEIFGLDVERPKTSIAPLSSVFLHTIIAVLRNKVYQ